MDVLEKFDLTEKILIENCIINDKTISLIVDNLFFGILDNDTDIIEVIFEFKTKIETYKIYGSKYNNIWCITHLPIPLKYKLNNNTILTITINYDMKSSDKNINIIGLYGNFNNEQNKIIESTPIYNLQLLKTIKVYKNDEIVPESSYYCLNIVCGYINF